MIGGTFVRLGCGDNPTITSYDDDVILQPHQRVVVVLEKVFVLEREKVGERKRQTDRQIDRHTDRQRQRHREREAEVIWMHVFQCVRLCE